jgi:hypothetical protein
MKSRRQRPLRRQLKVESMSARQPHDATKIWIIVSVCALITGSLLIFNPFKQRPLASAHVADKVTQTSPAKQNSAPAAPAVDKLDSSSSPAGEAIKSPDQRDLVVSSTTNSTAAALPAPSPDASSVPQLDPKTSASDKEFLEGNRSAAPVRKNVEKQRRQAERKRARLEEQYQKHEISSEAYKKGQEEYRAEIGKYRNEAAGKDPTSS